QAHLTLIAVARASRRQGIGRRLIEEGFARAGGLRVDLVSTEGAHAFYRAFEHRRFPGFRLYPKLARTRASGRGGRRRRGGPAPRCPARAASACRVEMRLTNLLGYPAIVLAFVSHHLGHGAPWEPAATFALAAVGVIPLALLMGEATE